MPRTRPKSGWPPTRQRNLGRDDPGNDRRVQRPSALATVTLEFRPGEEYWDKLQTEYAGGQAPDITVNQSNWLVPGASRGMFLDIKPWSSATAWT